jgi:hypothetical protein
VSHEAVLKQIEDAMAHGSNEEGKDAALGAAATALRREIAAHERVKKELENLVRRLHQLHLYSLSFGLADSTRELVAPEKL